MGGIIIRRRELTESGTSEANSGFLAPCIVVEGILIQAKPLTSRVHVRLPSYTDA